MNLLSTDQVASLLGITRPTVIRLVRDGRLEGFQVGRSIKIPRESVDRFLKDARL